MAPRATLMFIIACVVLCGVHAMIEGDFDGSSTVRAALSCAHVKLFNRNAVDGIYFLRHDFGIYRGLCVDMASTPTLVTADGITKYAPAASCFHLAFFLNDPSGSRWVGTSTANAVNQQCNINPPPGSQSFFTCASLYSNAAYTRGQSGIYYIAPPAPQYKWVPRKVYCDMSTGQQGWTLVAMVANSTTSTAWGYNSSLWTDASSTLNEGMLDLTANIDMKSTVYNTLPTTKIRFVLGPNPPHTSPYNFFVNVSTKQTIPTAITSNTPSATNATRADFAAPILAQYGASAKAIMDIEPYCNMAGFNISVFGNRASVCRFGLLINDSNDCNSCDEVMGFGCRTTTTLQAGWDIDTPSCGLMSATDGRAMGNFKRFPFKGYILVG